MSVLYLSDSQEKEAALRILIYAFAYIRGFFGQAGPITVWVGRGQ